MPKMDIDKVTIWMPIYTGDFFKETMMLSTLAVGAYIQLCVFYWANGGNGLPNNDEELARITKLSIEDFKSIKRAVLEHFFELSKGVWRSARLDKLIAEALENKQNASAKGKHAAETRWQRKKEKEAEIPS